MPSLSIVIPTYNEGVNATRIAAFISSALRDYDYEIIYVDDSDDLSSRDILRKLCVDDKRRCILRTENTGLATAVAVGMQQASGDYIIVMDADGQHPARVITDMVRAAVAGNDIVIPSRYVPGGSDSGLKGNRGLMSFVARSLGRRALKGIRQLTDPTSGFFLVKKSVIKGVALDPVGWKILIEVLEKGKYSKVQEIPYNFAERVYGASNMSIRTQLDYVRHLVKLVAENPNERRPYLFALVGASGLIINATSFVALQGLHDAILSSCIAGSLAMAMNFALNNSLTWSDAQTSTAWQRATRYILTSLVGLVINAVILKFALQLRVELYPADAMGILAAMMWNFKVNNRWTFARQGVLK